MADRVDRNNLWGKMRRNFIKWWKVFYIPVLRFVQKGQDTKVTKEEYIEQQQQEISQRMAEQAAQAEAVRKQTIDSLTEKAEEGAKKWNERQVQQQASSQANAAASRVSEPEAEEVDLLTVDDSKLSAEELTAKEILARLKAEADADVARKQAEIDEARKQAELDAANAQAAKADSSAYNASTNSFSGNYGKGPMDDATASQVAGILSQKSDDMAAMIANAQNDK